MTRRQIELPELGVIGVDPGRASGCIAYVAGCDAYAWPIKNMTDRQIWDLLERLGKIAQLAVLERVHSMPKQGVSSAFKFGASYGELKMGLVASGVRFEQVSPQKWQTKLGCRTKGDKNVSRMKAEELFPGFKMTHDKADALLIAEYGRRNLI